MFGGDSELVYPGHKLFVVKPGDENVTVVQIMTPAAIGAPKRRCSKGHEWRIAFHEDEGGGFCKLCIAEAFERLGVGRVLPLDHE